MKFFKKTKTTKENLLHRFQQVSCLVLGNRHICVASDAKQMCFFHNHSLVFLFSKKVAYLLGSHRKQHSQIGSNDVLKTKNENKKNYVTSNYLQSESISTRSIHLFLLPKCLLRSCRNASILTHIDDSVKQFSIKSKLNLEEF